MQYGNYMQYCLCHLHATQCATHIELKLDLYRSSYHQTSMNKESRAKATTISCIAIKGIDATELPRVPTIRQPHQRHHILSRVCQRLSISAIHVLSTSISLRTRKLQTTETKCTIVIRQTSPHPSHANTVKFRRNESSCINTTETRDLAAQILNVHSICIKRTNEPINNMTETTK